MPDAFALAAQYDPEGMVVEKDRNFVLPNAKGKADLRTRLIEVFKSADTRGMPNGKLDHRELAYRLDIADLRVACEGMDAVIDANGDGHITLDEIAQNMDKDEDGYVTLEEIIGRK